MTPIGTVEHQMGMGMSMSIQVRSEKGADKTRHDGKRIPRAMR